MSPTVTGSLKTDVTTTSGSSRRGVTFYTLEPLHRLLCNFLLTLILHYRFVLLTQVGYLTLQIGRIETMSNAYPRTEHLPMRYCSLELVVPSTPDCVHQAERHFLIFERQHPCRQVMLLRLALPAFLNRIEQGRGWGNCLITYTTVSCSMLLDHCE